MGIYCDPKYCFCKNCKNNENHSDQIRQARIFIKKRNERAFQDKVVLVEDPESEKD